MPDSTWGFESTTLAAPLPEGHSGWGRGVTILAAPIPPGDGRWGATTGRVRAPHDPIAVLTASGLKYTRERIWTGSSLR